MQNFSFARWLPICYIIKFVSFNCMNAFYHCIPSLMDSNHCSTGTYILNMISDFPKAVQGQKTQLSAAMMRQSATDNYTTSKIITARCCVYLAVGAEADAKSAVQQARFSVMSNQQG